MTIEEMANELASAIVNRLRSTEPAAFLVSSHEMRALVQLRADIRKKKAAHHVKVDEVITSLWDDCKVITMDDMDKIIEALKLHENAEDANEAANQPEWRNCY